MKVIRKIIQIDEELCNGCGNCVPSCAEGALEIVDGKARVIADFYCDGLGACLGECPTGALTIAGARRPTSLTSTPSKNGWPRRRRRSRAHARSCPWRRRLPLVPDDAELRAARPRHGSGVPAATGAPAESALSHWPVQIMLVPPTAPFLKGADLLVLADCVPVAFPTLHRDFLKGKAVMMGCPKFDNTQAYIEKFAQIARHVRHPQHHHGGHGGPLLRGPARHRSKGPETGRGDHPHGRGGHQCPRKNPRTPAGASGLTLGPRREEAGLPPASSLATPRTARRGPEFLP